LPVIIDGMPESPEIAEKKRSQKLLQQYNEIAQLAGSLAHEIKNPLSTILMNMDLLAEDFEDAVVSGSIQERVKPML